MSQQQAQQGRQQSTTRTGSTGTAQSRARQARQAIRKATKARLAISGVSGGGKTFSALSIAQVLAPAGRILVIDTEPGDGEQGAAELYADLFDFDTIEWFPPFDPRDLAATLRDLYRADPESGEVYDVVIVDSASHFWRGQGGTLDIADGRFGGWKTATPAQDDLVQAILRAPWHAIVCTRSKMDYLVEELPDKRQKITKLGLAPIQRDDLEYEFQVAATIDLQHRIEFSKTRCHLLAGKTFPANEQGRFAAIYREWLASGANLLRMADVAALREAVKRCPTVTDDQRRTVGARFKETFGAAEQIEADRLDVCWAWMGAELGVSEHAYRAQDSEADLWCGFCGAPRRAGWHTPGGSPDTPPAAPEAPANGSAATSTTPDAPTGSERLSAEDVAAIDAEMDRLAADVTATHPELDAPAPPPYDPTSPPDDVMAALLAELGAMIKQTLVAECERLQLSTAGTADHLRQRLAHWRLQAGWLPPPCLADGVPQPSD